jgi:hypothetical protein
MARAVPPNIIFIMAADLGNAEPAPNASIGGV